MKKILCVIPSRLQSTRLPQKPLLPIRGKPMVQWTYENASRASFLTEVIVATDSEAIAEIIEKIGGKYCMTDPSIQTGSERVAMVAKQYPGYDVVINLQGDEPFIKPHMLQQLVQPYLDGEDLPMTTLAYPLDDDKRTNPGTVKVILNLKKDAIYFSRASIPYYREIHDAPVYNHMGLYAFSYDFLMKYITLAETPLGRVESLEQLRVIEHGYPIRVCLTDEKTLEINTKEEYELAQAFPYEL